MNEFQNVLLLKFQKKRTSTGISEETPSEILERTSGGIIVGTPGEIPGRNTEKKWTNDGRRNSLKHPRRKFWRNLSKDFWRNFRQKILEK